MIHDLSHDHEQLPHDDDHPHTQWWKSRLGDRTRCPANTLCPPFSHSALAHTDARTVWLLCYRESTTLCTVCLALASSQTTMELTEAEISTNQPTQIFTLLVIISIQKKNNQPINQTTNQVPTNQPIKQPTKKPTKFQPTQIFRLLQEVLVFVPVDQTTNLLAKQPI